MLQVPAMTWLRISSGPTVPFRFHLFGLLVTASPFIIWFVTYRICRKPASHTEAEPKFQSAKNRHADHITIHSRTRIDTVTERRWLRSNGHDQIEAEHGAQSDERHQQHSGRQRGAATLFLAGYRYLDATFCVPCEFVRKRKHLSLVHGNFHLVDVKKIQRDIDQDDGSYNYGQHASNFTKDDGRRILTRDCLYRCRILNARSPVRPTIR